MNTNELAAILNGRKYAEEITKAEEDQAKRDGLVVVFGASDDLMEFQGAINDELGGYGGTTALLDAKGLLPERESIEEDDELEEFFTRRKTAHKIEALWCKEPDYSWTYATTIPHATFDIMEDGEKYCRGIVFSLSDLG